MKLTLFIYLFILCICNSYCVKITITRLSVAQSHIIPQPGNLNWNLVDTSGNTIVRELHLTGGKSSLLLFEFGRTDLVNATVEASRGQTTLGTLSLLPPSQLPTVESNGASYLTTAYSVKSLKSWISPGVSLRVIANGFEYSDPIYLSVGCPTTMDLFLFPIYLFGANWGNSVNFSKVSTIPQENQQEWINKWPINSVNVQTHSTGGLVWPTLVLPPNGTHTAFQSTHKNQQRNINENMGILLSIIKDIFEAFGDSKTNTQYYAPITWFDENGKLSYSGGGLGVTGGSVSVGDSEYTGVFLHELGHAAGLLHSGEAYSAGKYPYPNGSLKGSQWGYDPNHNQLLSTLIPTSAYHYPTCLQQPFETNTQGKCLKQSIMQGGIGCEASDYKFSMFADFEVGSMQNYFEGITTKNVTTGVKTYTGGRIFKDQTFSSGYSRWDSIEKQFVEYSPSTADGGVFGINNNLPSKKNIPVYTLVSSVSISNTPGATILYPPLYTDNGSTIPYFDPTNEIDMAMVRPGGTYFWYCHASGCDFTYRITYQDGSYKHVMVKQGLRSWFQINGTIDDQYYSSTSSKSQLSFVVNIPGSKAITKFEILYTPNVYIGLANTTSTVLLDYTCSGQGKSIHCTQNFPSKVKIYHQVTSLYQSVQ
ncbi:hypothetical protein DLAC_09804 [Tieghemostelium lacteum]|uniref:Peptidase M66 domain-containing protein n=1 Tax=Tieghemostelium lacteum TaxID=361077 RepID=A0A151Z7B7_TIELA|nr:hypothetical protein DLAC_09804 [Tieghemostelium lacteum]|eukprot:KYQ89827.1 hypothetical protein DLAC_09804 [Tieghemostelium lacteum]